MYIRRKKKSDKTNYRSVGILPNLSRSYQKLIYNHLYDYSHKILLPSQCGFCKEYSSQHCLLAILEKFKKSVNNRHEFGALLIEFSKVFDCIDHKLLIAKLFWYGGLPTALNLIHSYLTERKQLRLIIASIDKVEYGGPRFSPKSIVI